MSCTQKLEGHIIRKKIEKCMIKLRERWIKSGLEAQIIRKKYWKMHAFSCDKGGLTPAFTWCKLTSRNLKIQTGDDAEKLYIEIVWKSCSCALPLAHEKSFWDTF